MPGGKEACDLQIHPGNKLLLSIFLVVDMFHTLWFPVFSPPLFQGHSQIHIPSSRIWPSGEEIGVLHKSDFSYFFCICIFGPDCFRFMARAVKQIYPQILPTGFR